jgi:serine/threonine protein kinase
VDDLIGKTPGNYRIVRRVGRGGMAAVYKAYQPALERNVAIKIIRRFLAADDEQFLKRFQREAKAMLSFRHPVGRC